MTAAWMQFWRGRKQTVPLIFRWHRPRAISFRLGFFLLLSVVLHLAAFYVFEVVYPPNRKLIPHDGGVWLMPGDDPRLLALLSRQGGALGDSPDARASGAEDPAKLVKLRLSFDNYQPRFAPLPERSLGASLTYPDAVPVLLPPVAQATGVAAVPVVRETATANWRANGTTDFTENWAVPPELAEAKGQREFAVTYNHARRVVEVALLHGSGNESDQAIRHQLLAMPLPAAMPDVESGKLGCATVLLNLANQTND